jgi:hypothetical protein
MSSLGRFYLKTVQSASQGAGEKRIKYDVWGAESIPHTATRNYDNILFGVTIGA